MSSNAYRSSGVGDGANADGKLTGFNSSPGPYVATVVGHIDGSRMGALEVNIPALGVGLDPITVSYASPFYGTTFGTDTGALPDSPATSGQSYGMWFVPPDLGNQVLVVFPNGDQGNGYWFACIYNSSSHHMVPAIGRPPNGPDGVRDPEDSVSKLIDNRSSVPVIEYNITDPNSKTANALETTMRFPHEYQFMTLVSQGLDHDPIRGAISSSSVRESPSNVYGISTPGRKGTKADQVASNPDIVFFRKGGHQFVMDDGSAEDGTDQLVRLRTSGGHQILMNDTEQILYIASASGKQWLEFSKDGSINIFATKGFNVSSKGALNLHSDSSVNIHGSSVKITGMSGVDIKSMASVGVSALGKVSVTAGGMLSLSALGMASLSAGGRLSMGALGNTNITGALINLNTGTPSIPFPPIPPIPKGHVSAIYNGLRWVPGGVTTSTCTVVPSHEPWTR